MHQEDTRGAIRRIFEDKYKVLMIIPILMLVLAFVQIGMQYSTTGDLINRGVSLKGGVTITVPGVTTDVDVLSKQLSTAFPQGDFTVRLLVGGQGVIIDAADATKDELLPFLEINLGSIEGHSVQTIGSSLGASFFKETMGALMLAFFFMAIVVIITFRKIVPSLAVVMAAVMDIIITLAIFNLTGQKMSSAGIAGLLMLIGYSVDTDMLLSTKMLRQKNMPIMERVYASMRTGLMMTGTTLIAIIVGLFFAKSAVIQQIMLILLIGLVVDIIATYILNVGMLRMYLEKHERH